MEQNTPVMENILPALKAHIKDLSLDGIITDLPKLLYEPCQMLVDNTEKEVFLIGSLGVLSGLLPNIKAFYDGKWIGANLYVYVLAGYAEGKGALDYSRILAQEIHQQKRDLAIAEKARYSKEMIEYKKLLGLYNSGKRSVLPDKPDPAQETMLFLPANNSKSGLYQLLEDNKGKGIIFESEGDTLADALKQDYGNFSDTMRKAFHHENLQLYRKTDREYIEIKDPAISVVLSSTFNQLKTLIPGIENGLFSRFLFFELKPNFDFRNVFEEKKKIYKEKLNELAGEVSIIYRFLNDLSLPIYFRLTDELQTKFIEIFREKKNSIIDQVGYSMAGTANRLGIIAFRIMMVLSTIRHFENTNGNVNSIECKQIDFDNALRIVNKLERHAVNVMEYLSGEPEKKQLVMNLRKAGASIPGIEKALKVNRGTISRWCKNINPDIKGNSGNPT